VAFAGLEARCLGVEDDFTQGQVFPGFATRFSLHRRAWLRDLSFR
jgi:hypothetical protein